MEESSDRALDLCGFRPDEKWFREVILATVERHWKYFPSAVNGATSVEWLFYIYPFLSFYASDKNSFFRGERKRQKRKKRGTKKKRKKKNERILSKIFCTVLVMMDKKERKREKAPRRGQAWSYLVLSELGRFYRHAANRSLKTLEGSTRRDRHRYIYIYTTLRDKTANFRKASVFLRDVHSSGLKWRIPLERRPEKDESTRARPSTVPYHRANQRVTRSYVPRGVHDEWMEKARLETEWQDAKLWIPPPPNSTTTTAHERTLPRIRAVSSSPSLPFLPSLCLAAFLHSPTATFSPSATFQVAPILRRPIPPATRHRTWPRSTSPETGRAEAHPLNPIVLLPRLRHLSRSGVPSFRFPSATVISLASRESSRVQLLRGLA